MENCLIVTNTTSSSIYYFPFKDKCVFSYNATGSEGLYAVALQIEDFPTDKAVQELSSIALQFVLHVYKSNESCEMKPLLETLQNSNDVVYIPVSTTYNQTIIARGYG